MSGQSDTTSVSNGQLRAIVERIERLEEEKREIAEQIKEVYAEAKANGFDAPTLRRLVALRKKPSEEREEEAAMLELYMSALGMLAGTPLGQAAFKNEVGERIRDSLNALGKPDELTEKERKDGYSAAFVGPDGNRILLGASI